MAIAWEWIVIGNIDVNELENTGIACSKIQGLNMNDLKEVFYLGGKRWKR